MQQQQHKNLMAYCCGRRFLYSIYLYTEVIQQTKTFPCIVVCCGFLKVFFLGFEFKNVIQNHQCKRTLHYIVQSLSCYFQ